jgi:integrase
LAKRGNGEGTIYQRADGRWVAAAYGADGARRFYYGPTRADVAAKLAATFEARLRAAPPAPRDLTVAAWSQEWLEITQKSLRPGGWRKHDERMRNHVLPAIGRIRLAALAADDLDRLYAKCLAAGLSARSVHHIHATLHAALALAVRRDKVVRNVADLVDPPRSAPREMTTFSESEYRTFLSAARADPNEGAFLAVAATTGMRKSEVLGLRWKDVDLDRGEVHLATVLERRGGEVTFAQPKTKGSRRHIQLTREAVEALRRRRTHQREQRVAAGPGWADYDLVFTRVDGRPFSESSLNRHFKALLAANDLPSLRIHDLRHTAATVLLGRGVHQKIVSEMLGHSRTAITLDLYSHVTPTMQREAVSALEAAIGASG